MRRTVGPYVCEDGRWRRMTFQEALTEYLHRKYSEENLRAQTPILNAWSEAFKRKPDLDELLGPRSPLDG